MGKEIENIALKRNHEIIFRFDLSNKNELTVDNLKKADVAVEFTEPSQAYNNYKLCFEAGIPVVTGTTGWLDKLTEIKDFCKTQNKTFFYASNFSLGVNLFFKLNKYLASLMNMSDDYDVEISETHHIEKKDAPSGTAITLADGIIENFTKKDSWEKEKATSEKQISIKSYRIDKVPGTHVVKYDSEVDYIELTHSAKSRKGFALGAVIAAEFVKNKKGFLTMGDLLDYRQ